MPTVEYTGPYHEQLRPGEHLIRLAPGEYRTAGGLQLSLPDRDTRSVWYDCKCPACERDRGRVLSLD